MPDIPIPLSLSIQDSQPSMDNICGLLLAGGQGQRMGGVDKGLIDVQGTPLAQHAFSRLQRQVGQMLISANRYIDIWQSFGVPVIYDQMSGWRGPLAGIHAGMSACPHPWLVTAPCDAPCLPLDLVARLAAAITEGVAASVVCCQGQRQPTFALLNCNLRLPLAHFLQTGGHRLGTWLDSIAVVDVDFDDAAAFVNINTPEDLQIFRGYKNDNSRV